MTVEDDLTLEFAILESKVPEGSTAIVTRTKGGVSEVLEIQLTEEYVETAKDLL